MFAKLSKLSSSPKAKKLMAICMCMLVGCSMMTVFASAADGADMTAQEAATSIFSSISEQINVGAVVAIIGIALGAGLALYLAWWAIRKVSAAVRKGLNGKSPV